VINIQKHIISEAFEQLSKSAKLNESKLSERYSFPEVDDALNHFWNDLGKDPEVDDVIGFLEDEYPDWVPTNPEDYGRWYHDVAGEISARLSESKFTEAKIDKKKFNTGKYEYFVEIKYYEEEPDTFHVRANSISDLEDKLSNDDYIEWFDVLEDSNDYAEEELDESKFTEASNSKYKFDKDDIDKKIMAKDSELHIRLNDAAKLAQYLDSKGISYKIRNIQDPVTK